MIKHLANQAGDTIIEVLLAMSIVSAVLLGAYISTNRNVASTLDAQEHGQALKFAETQIEYLRADAQNALIAGMSYSFGGNDCFINTTGVKAPHSSPLCTIGADGNTAAAGQQPAYILLITPPATATDPYSVSVTWTTPSSNVNNDGNVSLFYRPQE